MHHLIFSEAEQPIVAQIFGTKPENFLEVAKLVSSLGFSGIDINMGCPDKNIIKGGSCAALFKTPKLAQQLIRACQVGAPNIPTSVKIRIGDTKIDWQTWIAALLEAQPAAITVHLRTRKEMSKVPAHWDEMPKIMQFVKDNSSPEARPLIIGNGDVEDLNQAKLRYQETGCDGVMIGRGIFGNPWLFNTTGFTPNQIDKTKALLEHVQTYQEIFEGVKPFDILKRHFKAYIAGFDGAVEIRAQLYSCTNYDQVIAFLKTQLY